MDRVLFNHIRAGDDVKAHQPVAAQNVRQGSNDVRDELEEAQQWKHRKRNCKQQDPAGDIWVSSQKIKTRCSDSLVDLFLCIVSFSDDEGGIELQILNNVIGSGATLPIDHSSRTSVEHHSQSDELSCANSAVSVDFQEQLASTIGLC